MKIFLLMLFSMILIVNVYVTNVSAQSDDEEEFSLKEALSKIKQPQMPFSIEVRLNEEEAILRYKNFYLDYNHINSKKNLNYIKLNVDNEIISMLGTGIAWNYGVTGIAWRDSGDNFVPVPTLGVNLYMAVMPKMKVYVQFSGMPVGGLGRIYDAESGLRYSPSKYFAITGGYRHLSAKVHRQDNYGDFKNSGLFVGVRLDF